MSKLEKLARMLTANFGTPAKFDEAMIAAALRIAHGPGINTRVSSAFLQALADAFSGKAGPRATIAAGRQGNRAKPTNTFGIKDRALEIMEYVDDEENRHRVGHRQEELIEEIMAGKAVLSNGRKVANGDKMRRSTVMDHLATARGAKTRVRAEYGKIRQKLAQSG